MNRFIVGTGRCGSTLLSRMLRCNPQVLDVSEFYSGLDWNRRFQLEPMSGGDFFSLISAPHPFITMAMQRGYRPAEVTYPFERPGARYGPRQALPWILAATLPPMTEDPDALYDEVREELSPVPARPPSVHAAALFDTLMKRTGRSVWVERSAASISWMGEIDRAFPGARFLHVHRAGEEAALSMREHPVFRLAVMLTYQIPLGEAGGTEELARLGADADHVSRLLASRPPARYFGEWWTDQILAGFRALARMDAEQYHEVRFEDLLLRPEPVLEEIATFLDLPDPTGEWRTQAAKLITSPFESRLGALSENERSELRAACSPGNKLLRRA
jgi:hypothetical protein